MENYTLLRKCITIKYIQNNINKNETKTSAYPPIPCRVFTENMLMKNVKTIENIKGLFII